MAVPESQDTCADFYRLVWPHRAMVLRSAVLLSHNMADAEDIAQETLIKANRALPTLQDQSNIPAWLLTILRHTWTDHWRKHASEGPVISLEALAAEPAASAISVVPPAPEELGHPDELLEWLSDAQLIQTIRKLPEDMRWTILLVDIAGYDYETSAGILDVPVGTIRSRLSRGRKILRNCLLSDRSAESAPHLEKPPA